jgi:hypothetical protein
MAGGAGIRRVERGAGEMGQETDYLILRPDDVDLTRSPLRRSIAEATYVMGAFNPGLARVPNSNLLLMVCVADAGDHYIVASGEADLACRITHMPKALFA